MVTFRQASIKDLDELLHIRINFLANLSSEQPPDGLEQCTRDYLKQKLKDDQMVVWLACDGLQVVGAALLDLSHTIPNYTRPTGLVGYISNVYTVEGYRRQGIARALMERLLEAARQRGCDRVALSTTQMGQGLYEQLGFKPVLHEMSLYPKNDSKQ